MEHNMKRVFLLTILISLYSHLVFATPETRVFSLRGDVNQLQQTISNLYGD